MTEENIIGRREVWKSSEREIYIYREKDKQMRTKI